MNSSRFHPSGHLLSVLLVLVAAVFPAGSLGAQQSSAIPRPDLSAMEETARSKIESMQRNLAELTARGDVSSAELAEGFGHLGQLFHAYQLLDSAAESYLASHRLTPSDYRWAYYLGLVRNAQGDFESALSFYERALSSRPSDLATMIRIGNALLDLDRAPAAEERFRSLLEIDPQHAAAIFGLAMVASVGGDFQSAVGHFEKVLEIQPEATVVHYPLGQAYRRIGDMTSAQDHLSRRGEEDVVFDDPLGNQIARLAKGTAFEIVMSLAKSADEYPEDEFLGFALSHFGDVKGSIDQLKQGLNLKQQGDASALELARIHYVLGGLMVNDGRDDEAVTEFQQAVELAPEMIDVHVKLGNAYVRKDRTEDAVASYDQAIYRQPKNPTLLLKRASALMLLGRDSAAKRDLEELVKLTPDSAEIYVRLAAIHERAEDFEAALESFRAASTLDLRPEERPRIHHGLASMLRRRNAFDDALAEYRRALEVDPGFVPALGDIGSLLAQLGRMREAADYYATWVGLEPDQIPARMAEATALILSEQHARARSRLEAALERVPDNVQVKDILARHLAACPDRTVRDGARAVTLSQDVFKQIPTPESAETVAMAFAEAGRFDEALSWQRELITRLEAEASDSYAPYISRLKRNLTRYQRGESCCED